MCGFAGFLSFASNDRPVEERRALLRAMGDAIAHRGPDDEQILVDGPLGLVFRRLAVVGVQDGRQPIENETGDLLVAANAEIYNHRELRRELLPRHAFQTASDCESALHAFEEWGEDALPRLAGMFAIAWWDRRHQRLTLARDRLGIKPLYLARVPGGLLFGSELKALLAHPDCPRDLDWRALDVDRGAQPPGTSYVQGVEQLPPGTLLSASRDGVRRRTWWRLDDHFGSAPFGDDAQAYTDRYAELLDQATREHLQRDVGVGLLLSGGVDSSLLAAVAARHVADPSELPCFTLVERTTLLGGDLDAARRLTASLGLPWHPVLFDYRDLAAKLDYGLDAFERDVRMMDSPRFDLEWVFKSALHRAAREAAPGLKVMLLGQGADEFAGGYSSRLDAPHAGWAEYLRDEVAPSLVHARASHRGGERLWAMQRPKTPASRLYHEMMLLHVRQLQHHNLWHEDRSSSHHSLEARVPFLDHRLVELLASVPVELHERLFWRKRIVRDALRRFAPEHELEQPKLAFLDSPDRVSRDRIERDMLLRCHAEFRERHGHDADFDPVKLQVLADRVRRGGPTLADDLAMLAECMAVAVFQRQCREGGAATPRPGVALLPTVRDEDWPRVQASLAPQPSWPVAWQATQQVRLAERVEVVVPARREGLRRYGFQRDRVALGEFSVPDGLEWMDALLRHLGTAATASFTVQDWAEEFDIALPTLCAVLDALAYRGIVEPVEPAPADAAPAPLATTA